MYGSTLRSRAPGIAPLPAHSRAVRALDKAPAIPYNIPCKPEWRNWQTRYVQGVVAVGSWEFESPLRHHWGLVF